MGDEKPRRGRGRPPTTGTRLGRLYVNVQPEIIAALTTEAEARGISLSELTRIALMDWMRRELPVARMPHDASAARKGVVTPGTAEQPDTDPMGRTRQAR